VRLISAAGTIAVLLSLTACGSGPPQIVDYSPQRGSVDISTAAPIRISFDHAVDQPSVESRLRLVPTTAGTVRWLSPRQLVYEHETLSPRTTYEVVLDAGYRDAAGNTYSLRHHWSFVTEGPPSFAASTPSNADNGVDPAAYLYLVFSRAMNVASMKSAVTIAPPVPFNVRFDPTDSRRAIIAPSELLAPNTAYQIYVTTDALDLDGNHLDRAQSITFRTGSIRPLHGWITFATTGVDSTARGLWIVNESGFPRQLSDVSVVGSFNWSPGGDSLLIQVGAFSWARFTPGVGETPLTIRARWAAALASGMGIVYINDSGDLHRQTGDGRDESIATDVVEADVAPNGLRVAYVGGADSNQVWGYDVGLHARYQLAADSAPVSDITWAPAGNRLAYLRTDGGTITLRIRNLIGAAATNSVASGVDIGTPAWFPDSTHIVFAASVGTGALHKAFVINVVSPPASLSPTSGLPSNDIDVSRPIPSPDGHQIAFVASNQVWLMNVDGTRPTALTKFDAESFPYSCREPVWTRV
jgi:Big-like domain-containing protein